MKTEQTMNKGQVPYTRKGQPTAEEHKSGEPKRVEKKPEPSHREPPKKIDIPGPTNNPVAAVKKMIQENIEWTEMRFYRHEAEGKYYVDIINKETGEVIRTVPEPEFIKIATQFKHLTGMNLDISG